MKKTIISIITTVLIISFSILNMARADITLWYLDGTTLKPVDDTWSVNFGTIAVTSGGTGLTVYAVGDLIYASATNTLAKLSTSTIGSVLNVSSAGLPAWSVGISLATGTFSGALTSATLDTGQGANELYDMNQNVQTTDSPTFANLTITTNATTGTLVATTATIGTTTGNLVGTSTNATSLVTNPTDCAGGTVARSIDASGNLTCTAVDISTDTNLSCGRSQTLSGDGCDVDAEIYTKVVNFIFSTSTGRILPWKSPGTITITEVGCLTDGASVVSFGEAAENSWTTSTQITSLACDTDSASTTSFVDSAISGRSRIIGKIISSTSGTTTGAYIIYTVDD